MVPNRGLYKIFWAKNEITRDIKIKTILVTNDLSNDIFIFPLDEKLLFKSIPPDFMVLIIKVAQYIMCDCKQKCRNSQ